MPYVLILPIYGCVFLALCSVALVLSHRGERWPSLHLFSGALGTIPGFLAGNGIFWVVSWTVAKLGGLLLKLFPSMERSLYDSWAANLFLIVLLLGGTLGLCLANIAGVAFGFLAGVGQAGRLEARLRNRPRIAGS